MPDRGGLAAVVGSLHLLRWLLLIVHGRPSLNEDMLVLNYGCDQRRTSKLPGCVLILGVSSHLAVLSLRSFAIWADPMSRALSICIRIDVARNVGL